jgi:phosphotransferase system HPr (HPr) family protein
MSNKSEIISRTVVIPPGCDFHARPSGRFVRHASKFASYITLESNGMIIEAKSIMGLMFFELMSGAKITLSAEGEDAEQAVETLCELIESGKVFEVG